MPRVNRSSLIHPDDITIVHAVAKTSRNLFLLGEEFSTNTDHSHRKDWVFSIMEFQCSLMAVDVLDFAVMSNHIHFVLRSRPDVVKQWDNEEVARRWLTLCPRSKKRRLVDGKMVYVPCPPKPARIAALAADIEQIKKIRQQLSSISWWIRLLCQKVAQKANFEDDLSMGHFFKGRFHSVVIHDEFHLLGCSAYVDLNAIKAAMAETIDGYDYTSASMRLEKIRLRQQFAASAKSQLSDSGAPTEAMQPQVPLTDKGPENTGHEASSEKITRRQLRDFLSPVKIEKLSGDPQVHVGGFRCSDKGFLDMTDEQYIEFLEWCIKNKILNRQNEIPKQAPVCLQGRGINLDDLVSQVRDFDKIYRYEAGVKRITASRASGTDQGTSEHSR